jgi:hypothetical protein
MADSLPPNPLPENVIEKYEEVVINEDGSRSVVTLQS